MYCLICLLALVSSLACGRASQSRGWEAERQVVGDTTTVRCL